MRNNEGSTDRIARIAIGLALLALFVFWPRSAWGLLGIVPLVTGITGYCPLYRVLGISTCPRARAS